MTVQELIIILMKSGKLDCPVCVYDAEHYAMLDIMDIDCDIDDRVDINITGRVIAAREVAS